MAVTFPYRTVKDVDVRGKRILLRADYNVPLRDDGSIADDYRLVASLPTLRYLLERGAGIVIIAHLGRPKSAQDTKYSLAPVAKRLAKLLDHPVQFIGETVGDRVAQLTRSMKSGDIVMLENLRFQPAEKENDAKFAQRLAKQSRAELFVQDGFGVVHRSHASTVAITQCLPAVAGLLVEQEYLAIKRATDEPNRPLTAILGGAKIHDKMPLARKFIQIADNVVIGGALANNFIKYDGHDVGDSLVDEAADQLVQQILADAQHRYGDGLADHLILPSDVAISESGELGGERVECDLDAVRAPAKIYDIGEQTIRLVEQVVASSGTVIWNGTLGMAEAVNFSRGSARLALTLAKNPQIVSVIGGGDTANFVRGWDALKGGSFSHVSTGGGASLALMAGEDLPGISVLMRR